MDYERLVDIINKHGGESSVLGIGYDNSSSTTFFEQGQFTIANNLDEETNTIIYVCFDSKGNPFHVIKPIESIQGIYFKDTNYSMEIYDKVSVRG